MHLKMFAQIITVWYYSYIIVVSPYFSSISTLIQKYVFIYLVNILENEIDSRGLFYFDTKMEKIQMILVVILLTDFIPIILSYNIKILELKVHVYKYMQKVVLATVGSVRMLIGGTLPFGNSHEPKNRQIECSQKCSVSHMF